MIGGIKILYIKNLLCYNKSKIGSVYPAERRFL